jgi:hypothetical protein
MRFSVEFACDGIGGVVHYDNESKQVVVDHEEVDVRKAVGKYLTTEREFLVPRSPDTMDDFDSVKAKPMDSMEYMELALSSLTGNVDGCWVDWESEVKED